MRRRSGAADRGLLIMDDGRDAGDAFMAALALHRHPERETDPPAV